MHKLSGLAALTALAAVLAGQAAAVEWKVSLWGERRASTEHVHKLAELVEEKTGGEFTMRIDYGGLSKNTENLDGLSLGAFEMAQFCVGDHPDKTPMLTVLELPFLGASTLEESLAVSRAVYAHPAIREDLNRWKARLLMPSPVPQLNLVGKGEPKLRLDDFRDARVRATGGVAEAFETVGAVPMQIAPAETYAALESGVVDMVALSPDEHLSYRTVELADWWTTNLDSGATECPIAVGNDAYEELSAQHRYALVSSVDEALEHHVASYRRFLDDWESVLESENVVRVTFPRAELEKFHEAAAPLHDQWIKSMTARGLPGEELYLLVQHTIHDIRVASH